MDGTNASEVFRLLGNEQRLEILRVLSESDKPLNLVELFDGVGCPPVSHPGRMFHLNILRQGGLVSAHRLDGKRITVQPNLEEIRRAVIFLVDLLGLRIA